MTTEGVANGDTIRRLARAIIVFIPYINNGFSAKDYMKLGDSLVESFNPFDDGRYAYDEEVELEDLKYGNNGTRGDGDRFGLTSRARLETENAWAHFEVTCRVR